VAGGGRRDPRQHLRRRVGAKIYRRLGDRGFQQVFLALLFLSGVMLIWTNR
jgi:hypothetical protein